MRRDASSAPRAPSPDTRLSQRKAGFLLADLCVKLGFCLPPDAEEALVSDPPSDVDAFAEAVFRADGFDPFTGDRALYRALRGMVLEAFLRAEERGAQPPSRRPQNSTNEAGRKGAQ